CGSGAPPAVPLQRAAATQPAEFLPQAPAPLPTLCSLATHKSQAAAPSLQSLLALQRKAPAASRRFPAAFDHPLLLAAAGHTRPPLRSAVSPDSVSAHAEIRAP